MLKTASSPLPPRDKRRLRALTRFLRHRRTLVIITSLALLGLSSAVFAGFLAIDHVAEVQVELLRREFARRGDLLSRALDANLAGSEKASILRASASPDRLSGGELTATLADLGARLEGALALQDGLLGFRLTAGGLSREFLRFDAGRELAAGRDRFLDEESGFAAYRIRNFNDAGLQDLLLWEVQFEGPAWWRERERVLAALIFTLVVVLVAFYLLGAAMLLTRNAEARLRARTRERQQRLEVLSEVARGIAHEVRNPLNSIGLLGQVFARSAAVAAPLRKADLDRLQGEVRRIQNVLDRFANFARVRELSLARLDFCALLAERIAAHRAEAERQSVQMELFAPKDCSLVGDAIGLSQVLDALLVNALQSIEAHAAGFGRIELWLSARGKRVQLRVIDDGEGIESTSLDRVFEPFHSTRERALGLGLAEARSIIEAHGGTIAVVTVQKGAEIAIELPREPLT